MSRNLRGDAHRAGTVDTGSFERLIHELEDGDGDFHERVLAFCKRFPSELAKLRGQVGLLPVPVNGSTMRGRRMGYFMTPLRDGTRGYFQRRVDDCLQAAIATCLQTSPHLVPDLRLEQLWLAGNDPEQIKRTVEEKMGRYTRQHGVTVKVHPSPPTSERRWIGVVAAGPGHWDHCLLMNRRDCLFDTASFMPKGKDEPTSQFDTADIEYGITIERT